MTSEHHLFDVVICGAGASGLAVALELSRSKKSIRVAIVDPDFKTTVNKTWCLWDSTVTSDSFIHHSWKTVQVRDETQSVKESLHRHQYICIKAVDYRKTIIEELCSDNRFQFIQSKVFSVSRKKSDTVITITESGLEIHSHYVVDARFNHVGELNIDPDANTLWQHFKGWEIQTREPIFDPDCAVMMDFRVPQSDGFAFIYLLPFSSSTALIELTYFNTELPDPDYYNSKIAAYLESNYGLIRQDASLNTSDYIVENVEYGVIPMTDIPYTSKSDDDRIISTGLIGGQAKASTGYAFARSQRFAKLIAKNILDGQFFTDTNGSIRFRYYDMLMLHIIRHHPANAVQIFLQLFQKNGIETMFDFLDEKTDFITELKIMSTVPKYSEYFNAMWQTRKKIPKLQRQ